MNYLTPCHRLEKAADDFVGEAGLHALKLLALGEHIFLEPVEVQIKRLDFLLARELQQKKKE